MFPTITMACQASLATGCAPGRHGLLGNAWFDRFGKTPLYRNYAEAHTALSIYGFKMFGAPTGLLPPSREASVATRDLNGGTHTLYEELELQGIDSTVVFNQIGRGARRWVMPTRRDIAQFALCHNYLLEYTHFEKTSSNHILSQLSNHHIPHLFMAYYSGLDGYTHRHGPSAQADYLVKILDPLIGKLADKLAENHPLDDYHFVLSADHGHGAVTHDSGHMITPAQIASLLSSAGRKPYFEQSAENLKKFDVIIMPQGGSLHLVVKNSLTRHWYDLPDIRNDILPIATDLEQASRNGNGSVPPGWADLILVKDNDLRTYLVCCNQRLIRPADFFSSADASKKYPHASKRLSGHFHPRSADIIVLSNYSNGFHFCSDKAKSGNHGNLCADDSHIPVMISGPHIISSQIDYCSIIDIAPTICSIFKTRLSTCSGSSLVNISSTASSDRIFC